MYASKSYLPNGPRKVLILGLVYFGTGIPLGVPVVVFGEGTGSYLSTQILEFY
jgi:hypothetical protein